MNPRSLLALWRERWGKPNGKALTTPYLEGQVTLWSGRLANLSVWSLPGVTVLAGLSCLLLFSLLATTPFSLNGQLAYSVFFICLALYAHRYAGIFITLILIGLAVIASTRYLYWRFGATLPQQMGLAFACGFCLCVAEAHLWLLTLFRSAQTVWPLKQAQAALPSESSRWPTVDIFIGCDGQPYSEIKSTAMAVLALDWPKNSLRTYLLDASHREDIKELTDSIGCTYLAHPEDSHGKAACINQALSRSKGEIVAICDAGWIPGRDFLKMTTGWFVRDTKLGMLLTPQHFLAPAPSRCSLEILNGPDLTGSCAMIRRAALLEANGVPTEPVSRRSHTALSLQLLGYSTAYIGLGERENQARQRQSMSLELKAEYGPEIFRVDQPFGDRSLLWKQRLAYLKAMLQFYYLVPRLIFFAAPLVYLLADVHVIQASPELFAAYFFPHLIHGHIVRQRMQRERRFTIVSDIRETVLAWYLLLLTAITLVRTELRAGMKAFKGGNTERKESFDWTIALPYLILFTLTVAGLVSGGARLMNWQPNHQELVVHLLLLLWALYNLMILAAMLAVAEESREIRRHAHLQTHLPAMIKLPSGRTLSCMTENFPEIALALRLPAPVTIENGSTVSISLFRGNREFSFPAQVTLETDVVLRASIDGPAQNVYRALAVAAYSRGQNWPRWLPEQDADRPMPLWISKIFFTMRMMAREFAADFGAFKRWMHFGDWMQIWKKKR